jgi:hypothetical protein
MARQEIPLRGKVSTACFVVIGLVKSVACLVDYDKQHHIVKREIRVDISVKVDEIYRRSQSASEGRSPPVDGSGIQSTVYVGCRSMRVLEAKQIRWD